MKADEIARLKRLGYSENYHTSGPGRIDCLSRTIPGLRIPVYTVVSDTETEISIIHGLVEIRIAHLSHNHPRFDYFEEKVIGIARAAIAGGILRDPLILA